MESIQQSPAQDPAVVTCPACAEAGMELFLEWGQFPVEMGTQWLSPEDAQSCPRGQISLALCPKCLFVANPVYRPETIDYARPYDNTPAYSAVFKQFEHDLAKRLIDDHDIRRKNVLEIGCGLGTFVQALCAVGDNHGWGFDPSITRPGLVNRNVELVKDYYPNGSGIVQADLIVCREVLEHIHQPLNYLRSLRDTLRDRPDAVLYFEVPSFDDVLRRATLWLIIYEHCCHFGRASLAGVFSRCGFEVLNIRECYDNICIAIEARPARTSLEVYPSASDRTEMRQRIRHFSVQTERKLSDWRQQIRDLARQGKRAVAWGAGARAVSFFNLLRIADEVPYVVDINPSKISTYLAGTGQRIVAPGFLKEYRPDVVIVLNSIYRPEIEQEIDKLGLQVEYLCA